MIMQSSKKLNFFLVQHGVFKHFSSRIIVHKEILDYDKPLEFALGEHMQALDEPNKKNNNKSRTLDCYFCA